MPEKLLVDEFTTQPYLDAFKARQTAVKATMERLGIGATSLVVGGAAYAVGYGLDCRLENDQLAPEPFDVDTFINQETHDRLQVAYPLSPPIDELAVHLDLKHPLLPFSGLVREPDELASARASGTEIFGFTVASLEDLFAMLTKETQLKNAVGNIKANVVGRFMMTGAAHDPTWARIVAFSIDQAHRARSRSNPLLPPWLIQLQDNEYNHPAFLP